MHKPKKSNKRKPEGIRERTLRLAREFRLHPADNRRVIENFFIALGSPVALSCYLMFKYHEYDQLVTRELDPHQYNDGIKLRDDFAAISFLRKHETLKTSFNKKGAALDNFRNMERQCCETNRRVASYLHGRLEQRPDESILNRTICKIGRILGNFSIDQVLAKCSWGPGVTQSVKGEDTSSARKFDSEREITQGAYDLFLPVLRAAYPLWERLQGPLKIKAGNTIDTVPKNAKTDRTIAIEPGLNSWVQSGIGKSIRSRLRRAGYNLNSDLKNQHGAYKGSIDGSLATIDFKAASDTVSKSVVELLLPHDWFVPMDAARSQYYILDKKCSFSHKFSTMGNGFTFELESLIFLAIALAVAEELGVDDTDIAIFGDDLVLPVECVPELTAMCAFLGFTINTEKSFSTGRFRESCGTYYYGGLDVKPFYFKEDLVDVKTIYRAANAIRNLSHSFALRSGCDTRFRSIWSLACHLLPEPLRLYGPVSGGDSVLHNNISEVKTRKHVDRHGDEDGWCGDCYTGLVTVPIDIYKDSLGLHLTKLKQIQTSVDPFKANYFVYLRDLAQATYEETGTEERVPLRKATMIKYSRSLFASQWYNFGDWVKT